MRRLFRRPLRWPSSPATVQPQPAPVDNWDKLAAERERQTAAFVLDLHAVIAALKAK